MSRYIHIPTINALDAELIQDYSYVQTEIGETFGQALARYMSELKTDAALLADLTGISKASIYYYTKDKRRISFNHIAAICIALRLHPLRSRYLFSLAHYHLSAQCRRDMIICNYICGCAFNPSFTLKACNIELQMKQFRPLTALSVYSEK